MKNKLKIFEVIALIISSVFFTWIGTEVNFASNNAVVAVEEEIPSVPHLSDWSTHQANDGLVERRIVTGELADQEKIPVDGLSFLLFGSYQNALRFSFLKTNSASDFFREKDIPVYYHNLRI